MLHARVHPQAHLAPNCDWWKPDCDSEFARTFNDALTNAQQWLPNQLTAVLVQMTETFEFCRSVNGVSDIMDTVNHQRETLRKEVAKYCGDRGVAAS